LVELGVRDVGVLVLRPWIAPNLSPLGFTFTEDIVTLRRRGANHPEPLRTDVTIRTAYLEEVPQILKIDQVAFEPIWQMTLLTLRQAARMSSSFTVAEVDGKMVGYQLSTLHNDGAHLARLAVLPDVQGGGIGGALLGDLIGRFVRRNILTLTVNTQATNIRSQNLYRRYGFDPTGLDIPYWHLSI
jgi:[ribosomal protein S18]-alanine N-acetyltransferase